MALSFDVTLLSLTVRWLAGWYVGGRLPTLEGSPRERVDPAAASRVSVVVPARNEAAVLPILLAALAVQATPPLQVIVVNDQSTDGTGEVAAKSGAIVVQSGEIPAGWLGKPWACARGAAAATGDLLVFLDADTVPSPAFLQRLAPVVAATGGLVSVAPYHQTRRLYEQASGLFNLVALMGVGASSMRRSARVTGAFGPCVALRAVDYAAIGGHAAVRGEVLEDVALARVCREHAVPVVNLAGGALLRFRMYPAGMRQLVEGWSKNFAAGASGTPWLRLLAIVAWISGLVEAGWAAIVGIATLTAGGSGPSWQPALFYALFAFQLWFLLRRIGSFGWLALVHPLATLAFLSICARSALLGARREVTWKGRTIIIPRR